jgi:hypothetical protein
MRQDKGLKRQEQIRKDRDTLQGHRTVGTGMSKRNWEFEIAVVLFAGFFIAAMLILGNEAGAASTLFAAGTPA